MSQLAILFTILGVILALNIVSLVLYHVYCKDDYNSKTKGGKIYWNIWMCLAGIFYWFVVGVQSLWMLTHKRK